MRRRNVRPTGASAATVTLKRMGRESRELPKEYRGPLDFAELIATLESLAGEVVCIPLGTTPEGRSYLEIVGVLERLKTQSPDAVFSVGGTAYLALDETNVVGAKLSTLEGNFYFIITVELREATILIGDHALLGNDLSDRDSPLYRGAST